MLSSATTLENKNNGNITLNDGIEEKPYNDIKEHGFSASGLATGDYDTKSFWGTQYSKDDDETDSFIFDSVDAPRLIDIEKEINKYERKHNLKSDKFYELWKNNSHFDKDEFNEWAKLYSYLEYAKNK